MAKRWTVERLREVVMLRGEQIPDQRWLSELLLSHERMRGRTEEEYPRLKAQRELDEALDKMKGPLPPVREREFQGLKQLRGYAADRERTAQRAQDKAREAATVLRPAGQSAPVREQRVVRDRDGERGM